MSEQPAIQIINLSKSFRLPREKQSTLKGALINFKKRGYETQRVLHDLSFDIKQGEFLGILGRNGSGKSTLLKTISGIYEPDEGRVIVNGKLTPFIELGVGFNPELSGRDNVYLNGALLGFSRSEVSAIYDDIVAFAELERFMDQKLKNYSSGMQVRLAFSIAIRANTDILVLDEVLAVGDEAFQRKCYSYFDELKLKGKTVVLVTHDMNAVQRFCTRAVVLNNGKIIFDGDTTSAAGYYRGLNLKSTEKLIELKNKKKNKVSQKLITNIEIMTENGDGEDQLLFSPKEPIVIKFTVTTKNLKVPLLLDVKFNNPGGVPLTAQQFNLTKKDIQDHLESGRPVTVKWKLPGNYDDGEFLVSALLKNSETGEVYINRDAAHEFSVSGWKTPGVLVHPHDSFSIQLDK